jgi:hypothetical protein
MWIASDKRIDFHGSFRVASRLRSSGPPVGELLMVDFASSVLAGFNSVG